MANLMGLNTAQFAGLSQVCVNTPLGMFDWKAQQSAGNVTVSDVPSKAIIHAVVATNIVPNPGFETNTTGWVTTTGQFVVSAAGTLTRVTAQFNSGVAAGQLVTTAVANEGTEAAITGTFKSGQLYGGSVFLKGNAGGEVVTVAIGITADNAQKSVTLTTSWQEVFFGWVPTADRTTVVFGVVQPAAAVSTIFVDDLTVNGLAILET